MNRIVLFCLLAVFLLSGCEKPKEKQEKPFYPAEGAVNARYSIGDTVTVVRPRPGLGDLHQINMT